MANTYFSKTTNGFYHDDLLPVSSMPPDVVQITTELWQSLLNENYNNGKIISSDANGNPIAIDPPPIANDVLCSNIKLKRDFLIAQTDWTQASDISEAIKQKFATYRQQLRDVPQQSTFPNAVVWPTSPV
jgi:hypothetical protein